MALRETASSPAKRPVRFAPYLQPTHPERKGGAFPFQEFPRSKRIRQPTYPAREGASHFINGTWYAAATLTNVLRCLRFAQCRRAQISGIRQNVWLNLWTLSDSVNKYTHHFINYCFSVHCPEVGSYTNSAVVLLRMEDGSDNPCRTM